MSLFNEYGNASIDNQNAVSFSFFLFLKKKKKKKFQFNEKASKSFIQRYFAFPFQITTTNKPIKDKRIGIAQSVLSVIVTSVFSDWLTSLLLFCSLYICDTTRMVWADQ